MLKISVRTLQNYEIGHRISPSTSCALFNFAKEHPKIFSKSIKGNNKKFHQ